MNYGRRVALTMEYVAGCLDECHVRYYRRLFVRHGGVFREVYGRFGVFWQVTFRDWKNFVSVAMKLAQEWNEWVIDDALKSGMSPATALGRSGARWDEICQVYKFVEPVSEFEIVNAICADVRRRRMKHPVRG